MALLAIIIVLVLLWAWRKDDMPKYEWDTDYLAVRQRKPRAGKY